MRSALHREYSIAGNPDALFATCNSTALWAGHSLTLIALTLIWCWRELYVNGTETDGSAAALSRRRSRRVQRWWPSKRSVGLSYDARIRASMKERNLWLRIARGPCKMLWPV